MPETRVASPPRTLPARGADRSASARHRPADRRVMAIYFLTFICMTNVQVSLALLADARLGWTATRGRAPLRSLRLMALLVAGRRDRQAVAALSRGERARRRHHRDRPRHGGDRRAHSPALLIVGSRSRASAPASPTRRSRASRRSTPALAQQGAVLGFAQSAGGAARTVGPVWSGFLYARLGASAPFLSGVLAGGVSLAVALALRRRTLARSAPVDEERGVRP
jgi:MFS family permease